MIRIFSAFGLALLVAGCAVTKTPVATGGSRGDASIEMSYDVFGGQQVIPDWPAAQIGADQRCQAWGYSRAVAYDGTTTRCNASNAFGCINETITRNYQCLD